MQDLSLIIPAKYESESLPIFLKEIEDYKCKKIVILEETDLKTINSIKKFSDIKIHFQKKKGYGAAIVEGVGITETKYFCIINADGSMNPIYLDKMFHELENKDIDFLFASRYEKPEGGSDDDNLITLFGNFFFTLIGNFFFRLKISDILFALDQKVKTIGCKKDSKKSCNGKSTKCITHNFWDELDIHINSFFESKKLSDLLKNKEARI